MTDPRLVLIQDSLSRVYCGNTLAQYLTALGELLACLLLLFVVEKVVLRRLERWARGTETKLDDLLILIVRWAFSPLLMVGALALSLKGLSLPANVQSLVGLLWAAFLTIFGVRAALALILHVLTDSWAAGRADETSALQSVVPILKIVLWTLGLVFFLDNVGVKVSAVVAGLGVGGVAIALSAQAVLGDLLSHVAILFDRPFAIGDFITVDDFSGTVDRIGIKTTRLRSVSGELLVFPNSSLTSSRIRNFKSMRKRRVLFGFGVVYETPTETLREIPAVVRKIVEETPDAEFERAHFASYGDSSLNFEVVYHVVTGDYTRYMDAQQAINFRLKEELERRRVGFAYPTRMVYTAPAP